ncbi:MAG: transcriptional regulator [Paenibacillaceae bacterium]|jgi:CRP/FNR family transcriptional regulator|nr:transcriptional regulator [Paenibacillaceae bacterium]
MPLEYQPIDLSQVCRTDNPLAHSCIRRVPIFQNLSDEEVEILHHVTFQKKYEKNETIFRDGEQSENLYVISRGVVKIAKLTDEGKEQIYRFLFPGDFFGQFSLLQNKTHYANAEALEPAVICQIHKADFTRIIGEHPHMAYRLLIAVSERLQQADEWISTISLLDVERRLAKILLLFYRKQADSQGQVKLPVAKKQLAAWIGTTPETISRKFTHFESLGILASDNPNKIRILDPKMLESLQ